MKVFFLLFIYEKVNNRDLGMFVLLNGNKDKYILK